MDKGTCPTEGCGRPITRHKDLCDTCWRREWRKKRPPEPCAWPEGCDSLRAISDYCQPHYAYVRSFGLPDVESALPLRGSCAASDDCGEPIKANGLCENHYWRLRTYGDALGSRPLFPPPINRKYTLNEAFFDEITTERQAYWLGFIAADGNIMHEPCRVYVLQFSLAERDGDHVALMCQDLGASHPVKIDPHDGHPQAYVHLNSRYMVESLGCLGILPCKSATVEPWDGPAGLMPHYWRGLFDGDGCIGCYRKKKYGTVSWTLTQTGSEACVRGFAEWAASVCGTKAKPYFRNGCWHVAVGGSRMPQALTVALYGDAAVALPRKLALATELIARDFGTPAEANLRHAATMRAAWAAGKYDHLRRTG